MSLVLLGSVTGSTAQNAPSDSTFANVPPCVIEWMDTAPEWRDFQVAVEDSLESLRIRGRQLEGQLALTEARLEWEKEQRPSLIEQWALPLAVTAGIILGAAVTR